MTRGEFNKWWTHFATAFPLAKDHVMKDGKRGEAALALWFGVLEKRELGEALDVTNRLFEGSLPAIPGTERGFPDWSAVPRHVSRLCADLKPVVPEWQQHTVRNNAKLGLIDSDKSMAAAFRHCREEILDNGGTMDEVRAYLDELYGTGSRSSDKGNYEPAFNEFNES